MIRFCDKCKQKCNKTLFGTFVILCKDNITLCMDCNSFRFFKEKNNLLNFLKKREILGISKIKKNNFNIILPKI